MKKMLFAVMAMAALCACGLLDSSTGIRLDIPNQNFSFSLNADSLRTQLEQAAGVSLSGLAEFPAQVNLKQTFTLDLPAQQVDLSENQDLKKYIDAGKVKGVTVKFVKYNIDSNTLNYPLPALSIWLDNHGATQIGASSKEIARSPQIPAGQTGENELAFTPNGREVLSDYLLGLKFALLGQGQVTIDTTQSRAIPAGQISGSVTIGLYFTVDPL